MEARVNSFTLILLVATLFAVTAASDSKEQLDPLVESLYSFTNKLFRSLDKQKNVIVSPFSIHEALTMTLLGADPGSQTQRELLDVLGIQETKNDRRKAYHEDYSRIVAKFRKITKKSLALAKTRKHKKNDDRRRKAEKPPVVDIFNLIITKDLGKVLPDYGKLLKHYYNSSVVTIDSKKPETKTKLLEHVNGWAKEAGFSQPIMQPQELGEQFAAILLTAIRVQGFWFDNFQERKSNEVFHNHGKADEPVSGMALEQHDLGGAKYLELTSLDKAKYKERHSKMSKSDSAELFKELSSLNMHVIEVPLQGGLQFTIFEPLHISGKGGELRKLTSKLFHGTAGNQTSRASVLVKVLSLLDNQSTLMLERLTMPKYNFEDEVDLKGPLKSVGLNRIFEEDKAQINHLMSDKVYVDKITHQAMIDVNKFGIKAAGVTKMKFVSKSLRPHSINVVVENPFLFMIRHMNMPLFIGQLLKL